MQTVMDKCMKMAKGERCVRSDRLKNRPAGRWERYVRMEMERRDISTLSEVVKN